MFKKILCFVLSAALIMKISALTLADGTDTINGMIADQSISKSVIDTLPESMKRELQQDDSILISVSTTYFDLDTGKKTEKFMPESDFKLTVAISRLSSSQMNKDGVYGDAFKFVATGQWLVNPFFEFTDCMGITWSDEFTLYDDYGYAYTKDYHGVPRFNYDALTLNAIAPEQGFSYDVDLLLFDRQDEITIVGKVYKPESLGNAKVCASYGHVIIRPSSVGTSFSEGEEIGMDVGIFAGIKMALPAGGFFDY